jgi:hypothetical protein
VDFLTLNVEGNFYMNQPSDAQRTPTGFRGLFFPSLPEASVARNSINADALWRVSDTTAILADVQYNLDELTLATTSIGVAVQRDTRVSYFIGTRYIGEINSTIASFGLNYQLSTKYTVALSEAVDLSARRNQTTTATLIRKFDRFYVTASVYHDEVDDESGFRFGIFPEGFGYGLSSDQFQRALGNQ